MTRTLLCGAALAALLSGSAYAQVDQAGAGGAAPLAGAPETSDKPAANPEPPTIRSSLGPYGELGLGGVRKALSDVGITYSTTYIGEALGVTSGGFRRGGTYEDRFDTQIDADLEKLLGLKGLAFHTNIYKIDGAGITRNFLGNLNVISGVEAYPATTKLYEIWLEQKLLDDTLAIRAGQLAADTEFVVSQYATLFVNSTFGWPTITGADLPNGGPAYPLATPAVRVKYAPNAQLSFLLGLFNGDPGNPVTQDRNGLAFRVRDPALLIGEAAYAYNTGKDYAGAIKIGGWRHNGSFNDQRADIFGLPIAATGNDPRRHHGDYGVYGIIDQMLYKTPGTDDGGLGAFVRVSASPSDRNLVSFYADGGLTFKGLFPGRPDDTMGVSGAYSKISHAARGFDTDVAALNPGSLSPIRSSEGLIEATYQASIVPGWTIQPDFQYVIRPAGGVLNPLSLTPVVEKNAVVVGMRTTIRY